MCPEKLRQTVVAMILHKTLYFCLQGCRSFLHGFLAICCIRLHLLIQYFFIGIPVMLIDPPFQRFIIVIRKVIFEGNHITIRNNAPFNFILLPRETLCTAKDNCICAASIYFLIFVNKNTFFILSKYIYLLLA